MAKSKTPSELGKTDPPGPTERQRDEIILSYRRVRTTLGVLGLALPIILIAGGLISEGHIEPSISDTFHGTLRDIFVGSLCSIGVFLISYRNLFSREGHRALDDLISMISGLAAIGVALFPNESPSAEVVTLSQLLLGTELSPFFHYASAQIFFISLALFCYVRFPKGEAPFFKRLFVLSGHAIVLCLVAINLTSYLKITGSGNWTTFVLDYRLVFWFEAIGVWIFAACWLVKGHTDPALHRKHRAG